MTDVAPGVERDGVVRTPVPSGLPPAALRGSRRLGRTGIVAVSGAVTVLVGLSVVPVVASADSPQLVSGSAANSAIAQVIGANTTSRMPTRRVVAARSAEAGAPSRSSV